MQRNVGRPPVGGYAGLFFHAVAGYGRYLWQHLDFHALVPFYPYAPPPIWLVALSGATVLAITTLAIFWHSTASSVSRRMALVPRDDPAVRRAIQHRRATNANRFTYFPAVGLAILVAFSLPAGWFDSPRRAVTLAFSGVLALILVVGTFSLAGYWEKSVTLFERTVNLAGESPTSLQSLGYAYLHAGRYDEAIAVLQRVQQPDPKGTVAENGIATAYMLKHQPAEAIPILRTALAKREEDLDARIVGVAFIQTGKWDEAIEQFEFLLRLDSQNAPARVGLEQARKARGF